MNANEYTDPEGDALTITRKAGKVWITCTTDVTEVTVGPIPATSLHDETLGSYIRTNEPDLMDGGVIAALIEQDAEGHAGKAEENATYWENTSAALTGAVGRWQARTEKAEQDRDQARADRDMAERERDEALRTAREVVDSHDETLQHIASGKYSAETRPFTAREHLEAAWETAYAPEGNIPEGAEYLTRWDDGRMGFRKAESPYLTSWEVDIYGDRCERRLLDPPVPTRPEGAEQLDPIIDAAIRGHSDITSPDVVHAIADALAEEGVTAPEVEA